MNKLLSIVIPTKDRYQYLKECILSLKAICDSRMEVVIQDNTAENQEILDFIVENSWPELKYFHIAEAMNVVENCDSAIKNSDGEYICFIGDDDSICYKMLSVVANLAENGIDSCVTGVARYNWPDMVFARHKLPPLSFMPSSAKVEKIDLVKQLDSIIRYPSDSLKLLPKVYHGIVSREVLEHVYKITGSYFPGPSPDMANLVALSLVVKKHVFIDLPLIVSGFSYKSTGGQGTRHRHIGKIEDIPWLPQNTAKDWDTRVPRLWTGETIYAESLLKSLQRMNADPKLLARYNFSYLYADFISHHPSEISLVAHLCLQWNRVFPVTFYLGLITLKRAKNYFTNLINYKAKKGKTIVFSNVSTLQAACDQVDAYVDSVNGVEF